jgi:nitrous oxide reductase accessory protein NosL
MKRILLLIFFVFSLSALQAQKDSVAVNAFAMQRNRSADASDINLSIYPVPVRNNLLNIKCDQPISFIKITNIIGQDIFRTQYNNPQTIIRITLDNPRRGMYLVTIIFSNGERIVKKIMIEQSE